MSKRLWAVVLGPPLILAAAALAVGRHQPAAEAASPAGLRTIGTCPSASVPATAGSDTTGSWWKTVERLDASGALLGRTLFVGRGSAAVATAQLPVESSVSGPIGGIVVATDDGTRSELRLVSVAGGCGIVIHHTPAVVRTAILDPHDGSVLAHLVDRATRADLGTWRFSDPASEARLVAPPLGSLSSVVGVVWATDLRLDAAGTHLAVQSCADLGCLTRIFDLAHPADSPRVVANEAEGPMLGFAGADLVTWAACPGYPCGILAWDTATNQSRVLVRLAAAAALTRDGRRLVALLATGRDTRAIELDPATGRSAALRPLPAGRRPLNTNAAASIGLEVADDEIVIGSAGADPQPFRPDSAAVEVLR